MSTAGVMDLQSSHSLKPTWQSQIWDLVPPLKRNFAHWPVVRGTIEEREASVALALGANDCWIPEGIHYIGIAAFMEENVNN